MTITIPFQIQALPMESFQDLFDLDDITLQNRNAVKMRVDKKPGFPCRVSLQDAELGETVILLPYEHHAAHSPYRASGPIFVRKEAVPAHLKINEIPAMLHHRVLSVRAYNATGFMQHAVVVEGTQLVETIQSCFADNTIEYLHIHNAKPGCFNCTVVRAK